MKGFLLLVFLFMFSCTPREKIDEESFNIQINDITSSIDLRGHLHQAVYEW
jgi:hypothetical protein